jgi:hypothetical protein
MLPPVEASQSISEAFSNPTSHGYVPSFGKQCFVMKSSFNKELSITSISGTEEARAAVAKLWSRNGFELDAKVSHHYLEGGCGWVGTSFTHPHPQE